MHCGPPVEPLLSTPSLHDSTHRPAPLHASNCWTSCGSVASQSGFGIPSQAEQRTRAFISTLQATPGRVPRPRRLPDLTSGPATCDLPSSPAKTAASQKWTVDVSPSTPAPPAYHLGYLSVFPILNCKPSKHQTAASRQFYPPRRRPPRRPPSPTIATVSDRVSRYPPIHLPSLLSCRAPPPPTPSVSDPLSLFGTRDLPSPTPTGDRPTALCCFSVATIEIASCQTLRLNTAPSLHLDIDANPRPSVCRLRSAPRPRSRDHSCVDARLGAPCPGLINSIRRPSSSLRSAGDASVNL